MMTRNHSRRIAMGAALLLLAVAASSCGSALPTAPALDSSVTVERGAQTNGMLGPGDVTVIDDPSAPSGGPDVTQKPPAGEEIIPTPGTTLSGLRNAWGHYKDKHKPH